MEILSVIVGEVLKKVGSLSAQEIGAVWGFKSDIKKLDNKLFMIQAVLIDAERRQVEEELVRRWLKRLKQVAYDADDLLDDLATELLWRKIELHNRFKSKVRNFFSLSNPIAFRVKMVHKIWDVNETLVQLKEDMVMFNFNHTTVATTSHPSSVGDRQTTSHFDASQIVGREAEKREIVNLLINSDQPNHVVLPVIPIVGIGGLGKTTLAQLVYNDESVDRLFDTRIWVCVFEMFNVEKILQEMVESITKSKCDLSNMDAIVNTLQEKLRGKRFLLVLDDVWNEEADKWARLLKCLLGVGVRGSKIIVTTRNRKVGSIVGTLPTHDLEMLSENDCWLLFKYYAFQAGGAEENPKFVDIGMDIVKKCGGVPLALIHIGSLLVSKNEERDWLRLRDGEIWLLPESEKIMGILKLSYNNLSSSLKQCFSYCAMFCKGQVIDKKVLVQLWMAEGFLEPSQRSSTELMEDIGYEYLNILMQKSFFQIVRMSEFECKLKMHDLVHDLACLVVGDEWCIENVERVEYVSKVRRLSSLSDCPESSANTNKMRTFILQETIPRDSIKVFNTMFLRLKYLRVLDLHDTDIKEVPSSVRKLRHLRYLDLSGTPIETLPDDVCRLYNLQTLRLINCRKLRVFPKEMSKLVGLRHLEFGGTDMLNEIPRDIHKLSFLQTLPFFKVGKEGSGCSMREIQGLNLGGFLQIYMLENVANGREAKEANLENKSNIHTLDLLWYWKDEMRGFDIPESADTAAAADDVLEGLKPHKSLRKLEIGGFVGVKIPTWLNVGFLPYLVKVKLWKWKRCEHVPPLGQLEHLRVLLISEMDGLRCIGNEFYGCNDSGQGTQETVVVFRSLRELRLLNMPNLEEWVEPNGCCVFPLLQELEIYSCPNLTKTATLFPSLTKLTVKKGSKSLLESVSSKASSLTLLNIRDIGDMTCLPPGLLQRNSLLQKLYIWGCSQLGALPVEELACLPSLRYLHMVGIKSLPECLPPLPILVSLSIGRFGDEVDVFPLEGIQHMHSLRYLDLYGGPNIKSLPQQLRQLTCLEALWIMEFEGVEALPDWLTDLSSLGRLGIHDCTNLKHLPHQAMQQLTELHIIGCPLLKERCQMSTGEEWPNIAHIPHVFL